MMRAVGAGPQARENAFTHIAISTILAGVWAFFTLIWSLFTPPQYTFPARAILLQPAWIVRAVYDEDTWVQDLFLFLTLHSVFTLWTGAWSLPRLTGISIALDEETLFLYLRIFTLLGGCGTLAAAIVIRGRQLSDESAPADEIGTIDESILPPLFIPSRTTHARLFPKKHAFSYSYLFVGVPVGNGGRFGRALSVDTTKRAWFHVEGADYLARTDEKKTLSVKLQDYLRTQSISDSDYEYAYLVTAPRFLGYSFNPVSFWYLYDEDAVLKYMILEVNNTFDERRMYLLTPGGQDGDSAIESDESIAQIRKNGTTFTHRWDKDFHVSPFNSRKGTYSLRAVDPLSGGRKLVFDNLIVLRSSKDRAKITARVWSHGRTLLPTELDSWGLFLFILNWWWVGLMTLPRILWQAQKLYLSKQLDLYFRPEVSSESIGRSPTLAERQLESFFRSYIAHVVDSAKRPLRLVYESPWSGNRMIIYPPSFTFQEDKRSTLKLRVLSPAFYSRLIHYSSVKEAFDREGLATSEKNRTILIEPAHLVTEFLSAAGELKRGPPEERMNLFEKARWSMMEALRCPPALVSFPSAIEAVKKTVQDIRHLGASDLDCFVQLHCQDASLYRRIVTNAFIAQRFAFGIPALVQALDILVRATFLLTAMVYIDKADFFDVLRPRPHTQADWQRSCLLLLLANAVHMWPLIKG